MKRTVPNAFVQICEETHTQTTTMSAVEQIQTMSTGSTCCNPRDSPPLLCVVVLGKAGPALATHAMLWANSVITSLSCFSSSEDPCMVDASFFPGNPCSSICNIPVDPLLSFNVGVQSIHLKRSNSPMSKIASKEYNMQSVNIRIALINNLNKGTVNNNSNNKIIDICLPTSNVAVCDHTIVQHIFQEIIKNNLNYCLFYDAVTESIILAQRNNIVIAAANHRNELNYNKIGAFLKVQELYQSQCVNYNQNITKLEVKCNGQSNIPENNIAILNDTEYKSTSSFTRSLDINDDQPDNYKSDYAINSTLFNILSYQESENLSGIAHSFNMNNKKPENKESSNIPVSTKGPGASMGSHKDFIAMTNNFMDLTKSHNKYPTYNELLEMQVSENKRKHLTISQHNKSYSSYWERWGINKVLQLCGGGESSLNSGTTGWGSPPGPNSGNTNSGNWGNTPGGQGASQAQWSANNQTGSQRPPTSQADGSSNKTNAGPTNTQNAIQPQGNNTQNNNGPSWSTNAPTGATASQPKPANPTANSAAGPNNGNMNPSNAPINPVNNGGPTPVAALATTANNACGNNSAKNQLEQLNTMRESLFSQDGWGGQHVNQDTNWDVPGSPEPPGPKPDPAGGPPVWKPNINNGTELWEANLRNGGQPPVQPIQKTPWGHTPTTNLGGTWGEDDDPADSSNVWTGGPTNPPPQQWGGGGNNPPSSGMWGGNKKENDWSNNGGGNGGNSWVESRNMADPRDGRDMRNMMLDPRVMAGDMRGISGRLNGSAEMWAHQMPPNKMVPPGGQWSGGPPNKEMMGIGGSTKPSGWEEPSPPAQRRNMPNFDDGTSLWGQQQVSGPGPGPGSGGSGRLGVSGGSHWKEGGPGGMGRAMSGGPTGPSRMPNKPDAMWMGGPRNGSWDDNPHNWEDKSGMSWGGDGNVNPSGWGPKGPKAGGWGVDDMPPDWKPNPPSKLSLTKEMVWNSKQFRILCEMGYKKEDVEHALRNRDMNCEEALELLGQFRGTMGSMDNWGRHRDDSSFDHSAPNRFPPTNMPLVNPAGNGPNLLNNMSGGGSNSNPGLGMNPSLSTISPALVQKILNQNMPGGPAGSQSGSPFSQSSSQTSPSTQQLRMLVQQIQMAVQAGYLNHQILNQPLAPQTLILLNQLLQQIKTLQQLAHQPNLVHGALGRGNNANSLHISVQITKTKQQIQNLQNQIAAQQAMYVKQQAGGHMAGSAPPEFFKGSSAVGLGHDSISNMQGNFSEMNINKDSPVASSQQSRLNQWKLPSLDKEIEGSDFSRAPGASKAPNTSPNMNPLGLQGDGTWSTGRNIADGWPSDSTGDLTDGKEWPVTSQTAPAFTDLVPEFEPGKPWKGNQLKSIEDDPSITPGSVVRSPLSIASIKDSEIFTSNKTSPTTVPDLQPLSLSNSTWSFNPATTQSFSSSLTKLGAKSSWSDSAPAPTATTSELWGAPMAKSRGPPPGLGNKGASWGGLARPNWSSTWLLLKNLTAQIDGSTLKTLCMQHGPLHNFHLYLNHGIALAKYSSREEANKAQTALNNCVLGNTTIFAENPGDSEVNNYLQSVTHGAPQPPSQVSQGSWRPPQPPSKQVGSDTWGSGSLWPPSGGGSLWTNSLDGGNEQRGTPSSLNSFLPGDLLGNEPM